MANPGNPSLISPDDTAFVYGNVLQFVFTVPTDTDNNRLVFRLELDTVNPPSSSNPNYKMVESRFAQDLKSHGRWEVKDGVGVYGAMATGGVTSTYYGRDARVTIRKQDTTQYPDSLTTWYWRIMASDQMTYPPIFNQAVFAQAVFASV